MAGLCVFMVTVHLSLILVIQGRMLSNLGGNSDIPADGSARVEGASEARNPSLSGRHILQEDDQGSQIEELVTVSPQAQCRTGHVQALRPVCAFGCLRRLYVGNPSYNPPRVEGGSHGHPQGDCFHAWEAAQRTHLTDLSYHRHAVVKRNIRYHW